MKYFFLFLFINFAIIKNSYSVPAHCIRWDDEDPNWCYECEEGYTVASNYKSCVEGCTLSGCNVCSNDFSRCNSCKSGYVKDNNGNCQPCPSNCHSCNKSLVCSYCKDGYGLDGNGGCKPCADSNCKSTGCTDDYRICKSCDNDTVLQINGTCKPADQIENCTSYYIGKCKKCANGYFLENGVCVSECSTQNNVYNSTNNGQTCVSKNCNSSAQYRGWGYGSISSGFTCSSCKAGYFHFGDECVSECPEGYELKASIGRCSPENCYSSSGNLCSQCSSGYHLMPDYKSCVAECGEEYFVGINGNCIPKDMGCGYNQKIVNNECVSRGDNEDCGDGYENENGLCIGRPDECGAGEEKIDSVCVYKLRYTLQEADAATSDDNENMIEWIFE